MKIFYNKTLILIIFCFIFTNFFNQTIASNSNDAKNRIDNLMIDLKTYLLMKDSKNFNDQNSNKLIQYINLDFMARATSGHHWKNASEKQKIEYKELIFLKIINTINLYTNELKNIKFTYKSSEKRGNKLFYVRGELESENKRKINVIWKLYSKDLTIIDLQIEKISLIKTQKSESLNRLRKFRGDFSSFLEDFRNNIRNE